jgi:hypothetical protein
MEPPSPSPDEGRGATEEAGLPCFDGEPELSAGGGVQTSQRQDRNEGSACAPSSKGSAQELAGELSGTESNTVKSCKTE